MSRDIVITFRPINDKCMNCDKNVAPNQRQELTWDDKDACRRRCGTCIDQLNHAQEKRK